MTDATITAAPAATRAPDSVEVTGLRKNYAGPGAQNGSSAVDGVSFAVPPGQFVTLLGPSGCGKTTTLRCIAGLEQPTGGRITMAGTVVYDNDGGARAVRPEDRPIAMVPQSYGIWPHMTVLENAAFPLRHGRNRKGQRDIRARAMTMLEQVGLEAFADRWATQLSGGQQQRLALARALISEPEVLLLDEPLSNLDAKLRMKLRLELRSFQERFGVTTIYVTHDQSEALAMSDTVILMNGGRVEQIDPPERIYRQPATSFVADFIGSANLLPVQRASVGQCGVVVAETAVAVFACDSPEQATPTTGEGGFVSIRSENVRVRPAASGDVGLDGNSATGIVTSAEYLGDRLQLVVDLGGTVMTAAVQADLGARPGDEVAVTVDPVHARYLAV